MLNFIDSYLNKITMYRLVLYYLLILIGAAAVCAGFGALAYSPAMILFSAAFITAVSWAANRLFAWAFDAPTNVESVYITAFILTLIVAPGKSFADPAYYMLAGWASVWAQAAKYMLAIGKKHLFNPAAAGLVFTAFFLDQSANWWVGTAVLLPVALIGGLLVVRKILRFDLVLAFALAATATIVIAGLSRGTTPLATLYKIFFSSPLVFFATIMLTEPLTTPPTRGLRIAYGLLVGVLYAPVMHIGALYSTPELALIVGNIFAYAVSPKEKLMLKLERKQRVAADVFDFIFRPPRRFAYKPGQYMEWTLPHSPSDSRGNRRYFTLASSPTEAELRMGVKFYQNSSTFKKRLLALEPGEIIAVGNRAGDFTLPKDPSKKLVFVAGGIGVTPFRSMVKYMLDKNEAHDVVMLYSNRTIADIAYAELFEEARAKLNFEVIHTVTDEKRLPADWPAETGRIDRNMIERHVPDWRERLFMISGTHAMVAGTESLLREMGVPKSQIKKDFFPGFA